MNDETKGKTCRIADCRRPYCAKGLCRLHWERQHQTGTTDAPARRLRAAASTWKGDAATYGAVHLRMSSGPRPKACQTCGATGVRFEWALRADAPAGALLTSPKGYRYSTNPAHYISLCKPCHNDLDLRRNECRKGHPLSGENLYIQPSNGKRFCRQCQTDRRRRRSIRDAEKAGRQVRP